MKIEIEHKTHYTLEQPNYLGIQRLHLQPDNNAMQNVKSWDITLDGAQLQLEYRDHFNNITHLSKADMDTIKMHFAVHGVVETHDKAGVFGFDLVKIPVWLFQRPTQVTKVGKSLNQLVQSHRKNDGSIGFFHTLSEEIRAHCDYVIGVSNVHTCAEDAWNDGKGVCQDHAHIMIAVARALGYQARYVSGYLLMNDRTLQTATHAWCEVFVDALGWVGFDVSNGYSPDERYVRLAVGFDYHDAQPLKGLRYGQGQETLEVSLQIQQ